MTGKATKYACLKSANQLFFDFPYQGGSTGEICLFKEKDHRDANFHIDKGQLMCGVEGCSERMNINGEQPFRLTGLISADGDPKYVILEPYTRLVSAAKKAKRLEFEAMYFQEGQQILIFKPDKPLDPNW